jgi:hypothetical protein
VIPGRWEKVDYLQSGTQVVIALNTGERLECVFVSSDRDSLLVVEIHGDQRRVRKSLVETVTAEKYDDRLANGAILGLLAGVGGAAALSAIPQGISRDDRVTYAVYGSILFGLGGLSIGTLVDHSHKGRELLYEAPKKNTP